MKRLTIFTPTYNRDYVLKNAYESLLSQSSKDFIWLIVDDGSTDNTEQLVKEWINENKIEIEYFKKNNGGKHSAYNFAIEKANTKYFLFALDSDDRMTPNAVEYILNQLEDKANEKYCGLATLKDNTAYKKIKYDIETLKEMSLGQALAEDMLCATLTFVFKTDYMKKFKFPELENEKFFTEAYIYYQMKEPMLWSNEITENVNFLNDGLTKNTKSLFKKYPKAWYIYNKLRCKETKKIKYKIKFMIYYIAFGLLAKEKKIIFNSPYKVLCFFLLPIGFCGMLYIKKGK